MHEHRENLKVPKTLAEQRQEQLGVMISKYSFKKGNNPWSKGKSMPSEVRKKISQSMLLLWKQKKA